MSPEEFYWYVFTPVMFVLAGIVFAILIARAIRASYRRRLVEREIRADEERRLPAPPPMLRTFRCPNHRPLYHKGAGRCMTCGEW